MHCIKHFSSVLALRYLFSICRRSRIGIQISQVKPSIAETKGITKSKLAKTLLDGLVPREVQVKSTVFGTADGKLPLDQKLVAAIKCKFISVETSKGSLQN